MFNLDGYPLLYIEGGVKTTGIEQMLSEMLKLMAEDGIQPDVEKMKIAFAEQDWDKTQQLAHKIKGGAVYVGTIKMKMACQYLERYWKAGHRDLFGKLYEQTLFIIDETTKEINRWLASSNHRCDS